MFMVIWVITWLGIPLVEWFLAMVDTLEFYMWDVPTSSQYIYIYMYIYRYLYIYIYHLCIYIYIYISDIYICDIYIYMCVCVCVYEGMILHRLGCNSPRFTVNFAGVGCHFFFHALVWPCAIHQPNQFRAAAWEGLADRWRSKHWKNLSLRFLGKLATKNGDVQYSQNGTVILW